MRNSKKMSDEETERKSKLDQSQVIRRGNRGVLTKLTKEVDDILSKPEVDVEATARLKSYFRTVGRKMLLANLDSEVLGLCEWTILKERLRNPKPLQLK